MKVVLDTWVLVERYKRNPEAISVLKAAGKKFEAVISLISITELVNVISREYGEREARVQYAHLIRLPLVRSGVTDEIAKDAGLYKTKYKFSLADALILATAVEVNAQLIVTGGERQFEEEWKNVEEIDVMKLTDFTKTM